MYDVPSLGLNYRMSELQAALGRTQVAKLPRILARRQENFVALRDALRAVPGVRVVDLVRDGVVNSHYCLVAVLDDRLGPKRNDVVARLNAAGVGTSVYYPQPVNRMAYYRNKYGYDPARTPAAVKLSDHAVALPVGPHLGREDMEYVGRAVARVVSEVG
jgi:dTDP-4-amino-4,6-dideoxygalactose transaminase